MSRRRKEAQQSKKEIETSVKVNSLADIITGFMFKEYGYKSKNNVNNLDFLRSQVRGEWLTLDRTTLSLLYSQFGICQAIAEVPVRDAYRNGFRIQMFARDITPQKDLDTESELKPQKTGLVSAIKSMFGFKNNSEEKIDEKVEVKKGNLIEQDMINRRQEWQKIADELDRKAESDTETNLRIAVPRWKIKAVEIAAKEYDIIGLFEQANIWKRVFGGAGIIIDTPKSAGNFDEPLDLKKLKKGDRLNFIVADSWELQGYNKSTGYWTGNKEIDWASDCPFNYYGHQIHKSRVLLFSGKQLPSMFRGIGRGFGLSYYEHIVRSINKAYKAQNTRAELLDDAKTNVIKFKGLKDLALDNELESAVQRRLELVSQEKNYSDTISIDSEDEYHQKQLSFSNFAEMQADDRIDVAADTRIQLTKLYGMTPAGFNSGDADRATYDDMVRAEEQTPAIPNLIYIYKILGVVTLGELADFDIDFNPLQQQDPEIDMKIKKEKLDHVIRLIGFGTITHGQFCAYANANDLGDGIEFSPELPFAPDPAFIKNSKNQLYTG
jgi:phage-related protein (TIGR01555 family)